MVMIWAYFLYFCQKLNSKPYQVMNIIEVSHSPNFFVVKELMTKVRRIQSDWQNNCKSGGFLSRTGKVTFLNTIDACLTSSVIFIGKISWKHLLFPRFIRNFAVQNNFHK